MRKRMIALVSVLLILALAFTACSGGTGSEGEGNGEEGKKILRTNNMSEPGSLDPALAQGTHESWVLDHTFEGLMKKDQNGELVEGMAASYELADDEVTYTFTLRMILPGPMVTLLQPMTLSSLGKEYLIQS